MVLTTGPLSDTSLFVIIRPKVRIAEVFNGMKSAEQFGLLVHQEGGHFYQKTTMLLSMTIIFLIFNEVLF